MPDYLGVTVFVAFDGDHIGREVGRASLADDIEGMRRLSQAIDKGNQLWGSWALASMGTVISLGGDEGRVEVPADHLGDLQSLRIQYHTCVGATVSVGVGMSLSEADKALLYAKVHGGNRVCFYTDDMAEELKEIAEKQEQRSEISKIADEYLNKTEKKCKYCSADATKGVLHAEGMAIIQVCDAHEARARKAVGDDFSGIRRDLDKAEGPGQAQPQHETQSASGSPGMQAQATVDQGAATQMDAASAPAPAGETSMEQRLHGHAQKQKNQDAATMAVQQQQSGKDALKQQIVKVLQSLKQAAPMLEEVKAQAPQVYKAVESSIKAMLEMAKQMFPPAPGEQQQEQPVQKAEDFSDLSKMACIHDSVKKPMTVYRVQNTLGEGPYDSLAAYEHGLPAGASATRPDARKDFSNDYGASKMIGQQQGLYGFERPEHAEKWFGREGMRKLRMAGFDIVPVQARKVHRSMTGRQVLFEPFHQEKWTRPTSQKTHYSQRTGSETPEELEALREKDRQGVPLQQAELPMPNGGATHHELNLPVGSTRDGRVKVRHGDGTSGWVEVRAGMVMSQDGHPISARNPGGK